MTTRPLRAFAEIVLGRQRSPEHDQGPFMVPYLRAANVKDGVLDLDDVKEMNFAPAEQTTFALRPGDVLVSEGSGSLRSVGASAVWEGDRPGVHCFQNTLLRLRPRPGTDPRFLAWWCRYAFADGLFASIASGANIYHLSAERLQSLPMRPFNLADQRAIADYLDAETARIDAVIEKKQLMKRLLDERWQALVRSVANRYEPWLPLRRTWQIIDCKHRTPEYMDEGYPVVSPGDVEPGRLDLARCKRFVSERDLLDLAGGPRKPRRGDVVYSRNASIGIAAFVDLDDRFTMGQDVCLIRSTDASQLWLTYMLNSVGLDQLMEMKLGSTFDRVNIRQLLGLRIPCPPIDIQRREANRLDEKAAELHHLTIRLTRQMQLLREHRQALITAAVTGDSVVSGLAA